MSLINEALKKAQKQREANATTPPVSPPRPPPGAPPSTPAPAPAPAPRPGGHTFTLLIAGALAIVALSVVGTVYLLRDDKSARDETSDTAAARTAPPQVPIAAQATPTSVSPVGSAAATQTPEPAPAATSPSVTFTAPSTAAQGAGTGNQVATSAPVVTVPQPTAAPQPSPTPAVPTPPPAAITDAPAIKPSFRIQGMVDKFRVSSIRLSGTDSKVILNDRLLRINDLVEPSLGLRLVKIEANALTFTDADGNEYIKRF